MGAAEVGQAPQFEGVGGCVQSVWRTHGVRGLYTGFRLLCMEAAGRVLLGYGARGYAAIVAPKLLSGPLALMEEMMTKIMTEQEVRCSLLAVHRTCTYDDRNPDISRQRLRVV